MAFSGNDISVTEQTVLDLLATNLFGADRFVVPDFDYGEVWQESYLHAVPLLAFSGEIKDAPQDFKAFLRAQFNVIITRNSRRIGEHVFLHKLLTEAGIGYTIIKGFACSLYYSDPLLRLIGDVDFLVNPEDLDRAEELLLKKGFTPVKSTGESHKVFLYKGCRYEMHQEPAGIPDGKIGVMIKEMLKEAVASAHSHTTEFGTINVPDKFHHGLIILLHMCHHLNGEGIGLRHLCDWAVFVDSMSREEFCRLFESTLKSIGLWHFACVLTSLCVKYLGCTPEIQGEKSDDDILNAYMLDIIKGGNFGQKDDDRSHQALLMSRENVGDKKDSSLKNFFSSVNRAVYKNWPWCRKIKLLLPLGWLFFGIRYVIRSLRGKRPEINIGTVVSGAEERKNLYKNLKLFDIDDK